MNSVTYTVRGLNTRRKDKKGQDARKDTEGKEGKINTQIFRSSPPFLPHVHFCPARGGAAILKLEETKLAERESKKIVPPLFQMWGYKQAYNYQY